MLHLVMMFPSGWISSLEITMPSGILFLISASVTADAFFPVCSCVPSKLSYLLANEFMEMTST